MSRYTYASQRKDIGVATPRAINCTIDEYQALRSYLDFLRHDWQADADAKLRAAGLAPGKDYNDPPALHIVVCSDLEYETLVMPWITRDFRRQHWRDGSFDACNVYRFCGESHGVSSTAWLKLAGSILSRAPQWREEKKDELDEMADAAVTPAFAGVNAIGGKAKPRPVVCTDEQYTDIAITLHFYRWTIGNRLHTETWLELLYQFVNLPSNARRITWTALKSAAGLKRVMHAAKIAKIIVKNH